MNKVITLLFVFLILVLTACGPSAPTSEAVEAEQAPSQMPEMVEPTQAPALVPTNTAEPTAIPPTPTEEPVIEPAATVSSAALQEGLPSIGELLWSVDINISTAENIGQFAGGLLSRAFFTLMEDGPFTVFAPAEVLPQGTFTPDQFSDAAMTHIVPGMYLEADLIALDGQSISTVVEGKNINITVKEGVVYLNDIAMILKADILARNGVIHVIDKFLLPPAE